MSADSTFDFQRVELVDVSRHYGRRKALARVSTTFVSGRIVALLGPNGAGKSTLIAILATLTRPTSGEVRYGDHSRSAADEGVRARIGLLGHDLFLYNDLTAIENLRFFADLHGVAAPADRVAAALANAGLEERAHDRVGGFSRGLRQRLALERALLHQPRLVLLDEPFTGLDDESSGRLVQRLEGLRAGGAIVIMATHEIERAEPVIDAAICLQAGRLRPVSDGAGALRERYRRALAEVGA